MFTVYINPAPALSARRADLRLVRSFGQPVGGDVIVGASTQQTSNGGSTTYRHVVNGRMESGETVAETSYHHAAVSGDQSVGNNVPHLREIALADWLAEQYHGLHLQSLSPFPNERVYFTEGYTPAEKAEALNLLRLRGWDAMPTDPYHPNPVAVWLRPPGTQKH